MIEEKDIECTGTARVTHELSEYEMLEYDYNKEIAVAVTTKAFQRNFPNITCDDVESTVKVIRAARSGKVDVAAERQDMENKAKNATDEIIQGASSLEESEDMENKAKRSVDKNN